MRSVRPMNRCERIPLIHVALCLLLSPAAAVAQAITWKIPPRGLVEWKRTEKLTTRVLETREDPAPPENPDLWVFTGPHNPPLLFAAEIDPRTQTWAVPPRQLRDLTQWLACDLDPTTLRGGRRKLVVPRLLPFGDLQVSLRAEKPDAGQQRLVAEIVQTAVDPGRDGKADVQRWFAHDTRHTLRAQVEIDRELDAEAGLVRAFRATFTGEITYPPEHPRRRAEFRIEEDWSEARTIANRGEDFETRVIDGIRLAADWLESKLPATRNPDMAPKEDAEHRTFGSGRLALVVFALLQAGRDPNREPLQSALAELRQRELRDTYSLASAILALEKLHAPAGEREMLLAGRIETPLPRTLPEGDRALMADWVVRLLANVDTRIDAGYRRRWNYVAGPRFDNSNTQYALLGLHSAALCGIEISPAVWQTAAEHWLQEQQLEKGRMVALRLLSLTDHERLLLGETVSTSAGRRTQPGGFAYEANGHPPTGSMTAAGVTGLTLCEAGLLRFKRQDQTLLHRIRQGIRSGFAWLGEEFTVRANPGFAPAWPHWRTYWLYSIERACELSRVALLQDRDWYFEGATQLLAWQRRTGEVYPGGLDNTCFAILFWKKGTLPVFTGSAR